MEVILQYRVIGFYIYDRIMHVTHNEYWKKS